MNCRRLSVFSRVNGQPSFKVDDRLTTNLYGQYRFYNETAVRLGVRDVTDEGPALADGGYKGSLHNPWGRYWYVSISKTF